MTGQPPVEQLELVIVDDDLSFGEWLASVSIVPVRVQPDVDVDEQRAA